ncbi:ABC transporter substrate-binding protein [Actinopolymorpha alba]|uniref:ABC transporter substrate-binding protein n=1 Tax=Actinopolymorpha alba TaxID=533267 RepID=UPI00035FE5E1|nr:ABC transporter substrate-binding protein [Actinopolymorpha alba]
MLAERVKKGALPRLPERMPDNPLVVRTTERPGVYGGTWNSAILGPDDQTWLDRAVGYQPLVRWDPEFTKVGPNVAESFEVNSDATAYVLHLRAGLRWSDGEPFTADDIVFAQNDLRANKELGGTDPVRAEKIDDQTIRLVLPSPNALLIKELASSFGMRLVKPRHYLMKFHRTYNPDANKLADEAGLDDWVALIGQKDQKWGNPDLPTLNPWVTVQSAQERIVVERNPYFWKVDQDGRQLPYIDRAVFTVVSGAETMLLKALHGDIDMQVRTFNRPSNKPVLARERDAGGYKFFEAPSTWMNTLMIAFNLTVADPVKRQVFNNSDFRIGMSYAIDRQDIIKAVYQRQGKPWQGAPRPESSLYHERLATQHTEYDPDLAARHLDRAGLNRRDSDGFRLGPDGKRFTATILVKAEEPQMVSTLNLAKSYWAKVGVEVRVDGIDGGLKFTRVISNQHEGSADSGDGGAEDAWLDPRWYLPVNESASAYATPWAKWYVTGGKDGMEPDASTPAGKAAKQQLALYDEIKRTPDESARRALMTKILDIAAETFWAIGISLPVGGYGIVKNNFHNVPKSMPDSFIYPTPGPTNPEQYFITS